MAKPIYRLTLHKTYYNKGFFNLGVDVERFVRSTNGPVWLLLGEKKRVIKGRVTRDATSRNAPRVFGGKAFKDWVQKNFNPMDTLDIIIVSPTELWIKSSSGSQTTHSAANEPTKSRSDKISSANDQLAPQEKRNIAPESQQRMPSLMNSTPKTVSNAHLGDQFELVAQRFFASEGLQLVKNYPLPVGVQETKKQHRFDLGSHNPPIIVECKSHTWTTGNHVPSAKITIWNEAMYYFIAAPSSYRKILFVLKDYNPSRNETLAEYYLRTYFHMIPKDVEIWEYDKLTKTAIPLRVHS